MAGRIDDPRRDRLGKLLSPSERAFIGATMAVIVVGVWWLQWFSLISDASLIGWVFYGSLIFGVVMFGCVLGTNVILMKNMDDESTGCVVARAVLLPSGASLLLKLLEVSR